MGREGEMKERVTGGMGRDRKMEGESEGRREERNERQNGGKKWGKGSDWEGVNLIHDLP